VQRALFCLLGDRDIIHWRANYEIDVITDAMMASHFWIRHLKFGILLIVLHGCVAASEFNIGTAPAEHFRVNCIFWDEIH
jgi:hypothetical protein